MTVETRASVARRPQATSRETIKGSARIGTEQRMEEYHMNDLESPVAVLARVDRPRLADPGSPATMDREFWTHHSELLASLGRPPRLRSWRGGMCRCP
jgi:hypothetical protein